MTEPRPETPQPLPRWLTTAASVALGFHLFALGILVLAAPSGPWPTPFGSSPALAPTFAGSINQVTTPWYLSPLHMTHNYHFVTNRTEMPSVFFEIILKDAKGKVTSKRKFPSDDKNPWVRFRERLLAQGLADDEPVMTPAGEVITAPGQKMETVTFWEMAGDGPGLKLITRPIHLVPRNRPVQRPREWSQILAKSYMRHWCEREGAASAELIRVSREPIFPGMMYNEDLSPNAFQELISNFGEYRHDR